MIDFITNIDFSILYWIQDNLRNSVMDFLMPLFSNMQNSGLIWIAIAAFLLFIKKTRKCGALMLVSMGLGLILGNGILKNIIAREILETKFKICSIKKYEKLIQIPQIINLKINWDGLSTC